MDTAQPDSGQDQSVVDGTTAVAAVAAQTPPAPEPAAVADGPWASDLALLFQDESQRSQVDQFLRTKVQPYTTKLEQEKAAASDAVALWNDLSENPLDTYVSITNQMFGEEAANAMLNALQSAQAGQPQPPAQAAQPVADPRVEAALAWFEQQQATQSYETEMARVTSANPDLNAEFLHPFVAAAEGNFDEAVNLYRAYEKSYQERALASLSPEQRALLSQPAPTPPPVIGSDAASAQQSTTPVEPRKQTLNDAIADFMNETRANRQAPPVGTV